MQKASRPTGGSPGPTRPYGTYTRVQVYQTCRPNFKPFFHANHPSAPAKSPGHKSGDPTAAYTPAAIVVACPLKCGIAAEKTNPRRGWNAISLGPGAMPTSRSRVGMPPRVEEVMIRVRNHPAATVEHLKTGSAPRPTALESRRTKRLAIWLKSYQNAFSPKSVNFRPDPVFPVFLMCGG